MIEQIDQQSVNALGGDLVEALKSCLSEARLLGVRGTALSESLAIDQSLAQRVTRGLKCTSPDEALVKFPSAQGLRLLSAALADNDEHAPSPESKAKLDQAIAEYERLLAAIPGGRSGLDALISDWLPGARTKRITASLQSLHRAETQLLGFRQQLSNSLDMLSPSGDEDGGFDATIISGKFGFERLSYASPIAVSSIHSTRDGQTNEKLIQPLCEPNEDADGSIQDFLLRQYCSTPMPELSLLRINDEVKTQMFVLPGDQPKIGKQVDLTVGLVRKSVRSGNMPKSNSGYFWRTMVLTIPTLRLVRDVMIHRDLAADDPDVHAGAHTFTPSDSPHLHMGVRSGHGQVDIDLTIRPLERRELDYPPSQGGSFAKLALEHTGHDLSEFHAYRMELKHAPTRLSYTLWYKPRHNNGSASRHQRG